MDDGLAIDCQPQRWLRVASHGLWHHAVSIDDMATVTSGNRKSGGWKWEWTKSPEPQRTPSNLTSQPNDRGESTALVATRRNNERAEKRSRSTRNSATKPKDGGERNNERAEKRGRSTHNSANKPKDGGESIALAATHRSKERAEKCGQSRSMQKAAPPRLTKPEKNECNAPVHPETATERRVRVRGKSPDINLKGPENKPEGCAQSMEVPDPPHCAAYPSQPTVKTEGEAADTTVGVHRPIPLQVYAKGSDLPCPVRKRLRTKSPDCWLPLNSMATQNDKCKNEPPSLTPVRRIRQRSKSPDRSFTGAQSPVRRIRHRSKSPDRSLTGTQSQQHKEEGSQQDSLALSLVRTPEWRELCRKRGLRGEGSKKHLAQQLWQAANSARKSDDGLDEHSSFAATDSVGGQTANA
jgi:hypothetical protein